ncbi:MAG TPA: hypothetical protein VEC12_14910 [Bacteroidia bacterium]|nr:hypothetical protein [Bacteroidia bacterium]
MKKLLKPNKPFTGKLYKTVLTAVLLFPLSLKAQYFFAYTDTANFLHVYDDGAIRRMEDRPIKHYKAGTQFAAFATRMDYFRVSNSTGSVELSNGIPDNYTISRGMMAFFTSNSLWVYWKEKTTRLAFFAGDYSVTDSLVCFYDRTNAFKIFYNDIIYNINQVPVMNYRATRNIAAYNTNASMFKVFLRGKVRTLEQYEVYDYQVGQNTVGYLDQTGRLKAYNSGQVFDLEELTPNFYTVADDMILYHTKNNDFKVFYKDSVYRLETFEPPSYRIQDGLVYYSDEMGRLKVFDKGQLKIIEGFTPNNIKIFNNTLGFTNLYNHLMIYRDGEVRNISNEVVNNYWLNGDLIVYTTQNDILVFVGKGFKPYRMRFNIQKY